MVLQAVPIQMHEWQKKIAEKNGMHEIQIGSVSKKEWSKRVF